MKLFGYPIKAAPPLVLGLCTLSLASRADFGILPGYDLFTTDPGSTSFNGQHYQGVPLGTFDFGSGPVDPGSTDTIVHRLNGFSTPTLPNTGTINLQMEALSLRSVNQFDPDGAGAAPFGYYFVTLQSARSGGEGGPGPLSTGTMLLTVNSASGGTFTSDIHVFFDLRYAASTGPIVFSDSFELTANTSNWTHTAPVNAVLIDGVDVNLAGANDTTMDFWGIPEHTGPHGVNNAEAPEPGFYAGMAGLTLLGFGLARRGRQARS
ncbi:MAG TPA: hypothetical protein VMF06_10775 [Candidatus Limnocylindria bacterium]|jgi:hypothetical protein|nr:hypothetical protein [Candidatus Limnocylindria bacterium]